MMEPQEENVTERKPLLENGEPKASLRTRVKTFISNNFLMVFLVIFVIIGIVVPQPGHALDHRISKYICIIYIFLCSGLYLRTKEMKEALMAYKAVIWGVISILGVTSIIGGQLTGLFIADNMHVNSSVNINVTIDEMESPIGPIELRYGLIVYSIMPCTIASGIVLVNQLNGHIALAVLLTVSTNLLSVATIPLYTKWMLAKEAKVEVDALQMLLKLVLTVLIPIIVGKSFGFVAKLRQIFEKPILKLVLKKISTLCLVFIVWFEVSTTSSNGNLKSLSVKCIAFVIGWGLSLHILFMIINGMASFLLRLDRECSKCIIILASHKTMALAVTVMVFLPKSLGKIGLIALAIIVAHISILLFDSLIIGVWLYWENQKRSKEVSS